jgi:predicted membrane protein
METQPINPNLPSQPMSSRTDTREDSRRPRSDRNLAGLIVIIIGGFLLARALDVDLPRWLFSFPMLLVAIGFFIGAKHSFRGLKWLIPVAIGGALLFFQYFSYDYHTGRFFWPILVIVVGFVILFKRKSSWQTPGMSGAAFDSKEEILDSVTIFGGVKKNIISKSFRGGEAVTVFGGTELNFLQSDMENAVVLELTQVFGGTKLIVPAHWKIQTEEMVTIFGGLNDKRPLPSQVSPDQRTLIIKGTCVFGGIDIKSY